MWILLSLGAAFCAATSDALSKVALRESRPQTVAWVRAGYASLFLIPLALFAGPISDSRVFWTAMAVAIPLEVVAALCYQSALRISPMSLSLPYLAFTPVFLLGIAWAALGEVPSATGIGGVFCVVLGAVVLQHSPERPLLQMIVPRERGAYLMLAVALMYAVTAACVKRALSSTSVFSFVGIYYGLTALGLLAFQWKQERWVAELTRQPKLFLMIGLVEGLGLAVHFMAFTMTNIAYAISIKRLSLLIIVFYGRFFFQEGHTAWRAAGAALMLAGAALIVLH